MLGKRLHLLHEFLGLLLESWTILLSRPALDHIPLLALSKAELNRLLGIGVTGGRTDLRAILVSHVFAVPAVKRDKASRTGPREISDGISDEKLISQAVGQLRTESFA